MSKKTETAKIIAENVRRLMNEKKLSSTKLAQLSQISNGTISKIIHGNVNITVPLLLDLSKALETNVENILGDLNKRYEASSQQKTKKLEQLKIGIMSISGKRITCIKDQRGKIIGTSSLENGLDLAEPTTHLMNEIQNSVQEALPNKKIKDYQLEQSEINLVMQSFEFEETRRKFKLFSQRYFKSVKILPDWQLTYLAAFQDRPGLSLVIEKGVSLSYAHKHQLKKLGGWKFPVYDIGGENWLGLKTIHHTIEAFEGYVPMSKLASDVLAKYGGKIEKITEACFKGAKNTDVYATFTDILLRNYFMKDSAAENIIKLGFDEIYKIVDRADNILEKKLKIAINGSMLDIYKPFFDKKRTTEAPTDAKKVEMLADISTELLSKYEIEDY